MKGLFCFYRRMDMQKSHQKPLKTIVAIGDSIVEGYPFGKEASFIAFFMKGLPEDEYTIHNLGIAGDTTQDVLRRFREEALPYRPDIFILHVGANDVFRGLSMVEAFCHIQAICEEAKDGGAKVILSSLLLIEDDTLKNQSIASFNQKLKNLSERGGFIFCSWQEIEDEIPLVDGVHPTRRGYEVMGTRLLELFVKEA